MMRRPQFLTATLLRACGRYEKMLGTRLRPCARQARGGYGEGRRRVCNSDPAIETCHPSPRCGRGSHGAEGPLPGASQESENE